jgi:hypothetical protein
MLEGCPEFCGQASVGDNDDADHRVMHIPVSGGRQQLRHDQEQQSLPEAAHDD